MSKVFGISRETIKEMYEDISHRLSEGCGTCTFCRDEIKTLRLGYSEDQQFVLGMVYQDYIRNRIEQAKSLAESRGPAFSCPPSDN